VVTAPATGNLRRVSLVAGDAVEVGDAITTIVAMPPAPTNTRDRAHQEALVALSRAGVKRAKARVMLAQTAVAHDKGELARSRALYESGALAQAAVDAAELAYQSAVAELESARSAVDMARFEVSSNATLLQDDPRTYSKLPAIELTSPSRGVVLRVLKRDAGPVTAGTPILEVGDPSRLEVVVDLLTADAMQVRPGARVEMTQWGGGLTLVGSVSRTEPSAYTSVSALGVEEQRVNVIVTLPPAVEGQPEMGDGFRVHGRVEVERRDNALRVPVAGLLRRDEGWAVYVSEQGKAVLRNIEIGAKNDRFAEVKSGVEEGARIVLYPSDRIEDGARIASQ